MPTYVYACSACDTVFEFEQRIVEDPLDTCINCGAKGTVKRVIQPVGIAFKGSGFHINDYSPSSSASTSTETPKPEPATETKTETPAPAPTPAPSTTTTSSES